MTLPADIAATESRHTRDIERLWTDRGEDVGIGAHADRAALLRAYRELAQANERLDKLSDELIEERDRAQDALQDTHLALGGDGEWVGRSCPPPPPDSGDLHLDVPELAREIKAERDRLRAEVERLRDMRHKELSYVAECLRNIHKQRGDEARDSAIDALRWCTSRLNVELPRALCAQQHDPEQQPIDAEGQPESASSAGEQNE